MRGVIYILGGLVAVGMLPGQISAHAITSGSGHLRTDFVVISVAEPSEPTIREAIVVSNDTIDVDEYWRFIHPAIPRARHCQQVRQDEAPIRPSRSFRVGCNDYVSLRVVGRKGFQFAISAGDHFDRPTQIPGWQIASILEADESEQVSVVDQQTKTKRLNTEISALQDASIALLRLSGGVGGPPKLIGGEPKTYRGDSQDNRERADDALIVRFEPAVGLFEGERRSHVEGGAIFSVIVIGGLLTVLWLHQAQR